MSIFIYKVKIRLLPYGVDLRIKWANMYNKYNSICLAISAPYLLVMITGLCMSLSHLDCELLKGRNHTSFIFSSPPPRRASCKYLQCRITKVDLCQWWVSILGVVQKGREGKSYVYDTNIWLPWVTFSWQGKKERTHQLWWTPAIHNHTLSAGKLWYMLQN